MNDPEFFGQNVLELLNGAFIGGTLSSFLVDLVPQEPDLLIISVALLIVLLNLFDLVVSVFDSFVENILKLSDLTFVDHTLSPFILDNVPQLPDLVVVLLSDSGMVMYMLCLFFKDVFKFADGSFVCETLVSLLFNLVS